VTPAGTHPRDNLGEGLAIRDKCEDPFSTNRNEQRDRTIRGSSPGEREFHFCSGDRDEDSVSTPVNISFGASERNSRKYGRDPVKECDRFGHGKSIDTHPDVFAGLSFPTEDGVL